MTGRVIRETVFLGFWSVVSMTTRGEVCAVRI